MTRGRRRPSLGLRGRLAWGVLVAVLIPCAVASTIAYLHLSRTATDQFHEQAQRQAESDVFGASTSAQLFGNDGSFTAGPLDLDNVFTATFQNFFIPNKTYAVAVMKPGPNGTYSFTRSGPGDSDTLHTTASPELVAATPFAQFVGSPSTVLADGIEVHADGRDWLAVGGETARGTAPGYFDAPVVAVDYLDLTPLQTQVSDYRTSLVSVTAAAAVFAAAVAWLLAGLVERPVRRAAVAAREFGGGRRATRLPVRGRDAVADLSGSFNTMADDLTATLSTLEASEAQQRQFAADVSHELRTPMTALVAAAAALDDPATRDRAAVLVAPQLRRLSALTEDLVETSMLDAGTAVLDCEPIDVLALCADVVAHSTAPTAVTLTGDGDTVATIDPRRIHTVMRNLVGNALRHGAPPVTITVTGTADAVTVTVADGGPGLPAGLGDMVFDRFVRGDRARTRSAGVGSGLGLSLARDNTEAHGGTLTAADAPAGGAVFTLRLPRTAIDDPATDPATDPGAVAAGRAGTTSPTRTTGATSSRDGWRGLLATRGRRLAAVGVVVLVAAAVTGVVVLGRGDDTPAPAGIVLSPQQQEVRALFGDLTGLGPLSVVARADGPEGSTAELVQARSATAGTCLGVRVSPSSADQQSQGGSCNPDVPPAEAVPQGATGGAGGRWTWVSPTSGVTYSGWYGSQASATTVELRIDNQVASRATVTSDGHYLLPAVDDAKQGCRAVVGLDASGAILDSLSLSTACDPAVQSPAGS